MKVVALLSGGKDSCYSILKARAHGHEVVALAHITPPTDEADSFMYQSVGSAAVHSISMALHLPLFTRATRAVAKTTDLAYTPTAGDEVEDLTLLLRDAVAVVPGLQAVTAGALWSDYQRLRVESAASRAGLLSLAPLWRRPQRELLDEMLAAGVEAVLVKVAGLGLHAGHLGKSLAEMRPLLVELEDKHGSHVCGEGGEYETLVLAMPGFSHRLVLDNPRIVHHVESDIAPVAYLQIDNCLLEPRDRSGDASLVTPVPPVPVELRPLEGTEDSFRSGGTDSPPECTETAEPRASCVVRGEYAYTVALSNLNGAAGVTTAAKAMQQRLQESGFSLGDTLYVWLNLDSVNGDSYKDANRAYVSVFDIPECIPPPSRACIAVPNGGHPVSMAAIARRARRSDPADSRTLHVQSLSEWAPPCIGPYAQVVEDRGISFVSGALAIHAPDAAIQKGAGVRAQTRGCLFNIRRTLEATRTKFGDLTYFVAYTVSPDFFEAIHEEFWQLVVRERAVLAVVPCTGLPKDALVEIRAVGSHDDEEDRVKLETEERCSDFSATVANGGEFVAAHAVRHGSLIYGQVFVADEDGDCSEVCKRFLDRLGALEKDFDCRLLHADVYVLERDMDEVETCLHSASGRNFHITRTSCIPGGARLLGVLTLACPELLAI